MRPKQALGPSQISAILEGAAQVFNNRDDPLDFPKSSQTLDSFSIFQGMVTFRDLPVLGNPQMTTRRPG